MIPLYKNISQTIYTVEINIPKSVLISNVLLIKNKKIILVFETMFQENYAWYLTPPSRKVNMGITDLNINT